MPLTDVVADAPELFPAECLSTPSPSPAQSTAPSPTPSPTPAPSPKADPDPPEPIRGQLILGADKHSPVFAIYKDESGKLLSVYYGFELLEIINNDRECPAFKLMLGRLFNAGINRRALSEAFEVDPKTLQRFGNVLLQGDPVELVRVLEGRAAGRKITSAVKRFAQLRWPDLVADGSYGAVKGLHHEIQEVFEMEISRSGLKDLIRELKKGIPSTEASATVAPACPPLGELISDTSSPSAPLAVVPPDPEPETKAAGTPCPTDGAGGLAPIGTTTAEVSASVAWESSPRCEPKSDIQTPAAQSADRPTEPASEIKETGTQCLAGSSGELAANTTENKGFQASNPPTPPGNTADKSPFFPRDPQNAQYWCDHAGILIFATALAMISKVSGTAHAILAQWMSALWLGAQNIEQTKFLNWDDLQLILGDFVRFPTHQRDQLKVLAADTGLIDELWRFNLKNLASQVGSDFYLDPHTKQYTGEQKILKGWCGKIHFADKVLHSDFIHTAQGAPIYLETTDNFADLRQRFFPFIGRARRVLQWPANRVLTFVLDRAIFGEEVFERIIADPTLHLITWQKGFVAEAWDPQKVTGKTTITRVRNSSTDLRTFHFEYIDRIWAKNPKLRQIVVRATNDRGRTIQVAILTTDLTRAAEQIIHLMFNRWLQENDFKYLDKHYGINQITSYRSIEYAKLKGQVEDREVKSAERKALDLTLKAATERLKRQLLAEEQAKKAHEGRELKRKELEGKIAQLGATETPESKALKRKMAGIKSADVNYETTLVARRKSIEKIHLEIMGIQEKIHQTKATESRLDALVQAEMVKLDGQSKRLMDVLKISARNLFYQALGPFKKAYDNYRDDHEHFRQLTQSPGILEVRGEQIVIHLLPRTNYGGELRKVVNQTLDGINAQGLEHPCLPGRKLTFRLGKRSEMEVKINVDI